MITTQKIFVPDRTEFNRIMEEVLNDIEVKAFLKEYEDLIDDDMIFRGASVLKEFVDRRNDEHYIPRLSIYSGNFNVSYEERDTPLMQRYRDKVPSKTFYDTSTVKYKDDRLDDFVMATGNAMALGYVNEFLENYRYGDRSKGMWLHGNFGRGKSYLMGCFTTALGERQVGVNFVSSAQLMNDLYQIMKQNTMDNSVQKQLDYLMKCEVLIIDDIGAEKATRHNFVDVLYTIFKYRGENRKPTFVTSNYTKRDYLDKAFGEGQLDKIEVARMQEQIDVLMKEVQMTGQNWRDKA